MEFKDLKIGDSVYILENTGTFKKSTSYNIGIIVSVTAPYDDTTSGNPYLASVLKKKLIDLTISCEGIQKKLTVGANKVSITDSNLGLTISTDKQEMITHLQNQYKEYQDKIQSVEFYTREAEKCKKILDQLRSDGKEEIKQQQVNEDNSKTETIRIS